MDFPRIKTIRTYALEAPLEKPWAYSQMWRYTRWSMLLELVAEDGTTGWGEGEYAPTASADAVHTEFAHLFLGQNPMNAAQLWERGYAYARDYARSGIATIALSALETALYDLNGKLLGVPASTLLGGRFRDKVPVYLTGGYAHDLDNIVEEVVAASTERAGNGARALKLKVGFGIDLDAELVHKVREAVGPSVRLMMDANRAYTATEAIRLAQRVRDCDLYWFEEPVLVEDLEGYREVRTRGGIPVAAGEGEYTRWGFRRLLESGGVDFVQPAVAMAGGLGECRNIAYLASAFNVRCIPHSWGLGVATAATLQLIASLPSVPPRLVQDPPMLEVDITKNALRDNPLCEGPVIEDGFALVPSGPGTGAKVNVAAVREVAKSVTESHA
jgi:D-galactarolactone cycloisomerase